jgi:type II secretory pathway component PulF
MPTFAFVGRTRGGENITGERMADTLEAAVSTLRREQIMVTKSATRRRSTRSSPT